MYDTKTLIIRADGSEHLGMGHIMRCLAFAQGLEKMGAKPTLVTRDYNQETSKLIQRYGYDAETIPKDCNFKEDLVLTLKLADKHNTKLVIVDLCNVDTLANLSGYHEYLQGLKSKDKFLIAIDDLNEMAFPSHIVINPNCGAENRNYDFGSATKFLLGPAYFIFREEFVEAAKRKREVKEDAQNILVTMGGSDLLNLTEKVVRALSKLGKASKLNLRIVLGIAYRKRSTRDKLREISENFAQTYELIQGSDNMAELMLWSDLAITGGGLTKYETAVTGTPSIIISQVEHQADLAKEFEKERTTIYLGFGSEVEEKEIAEAVNRLLSNYSLRDRMSKMGKKLVDGNGVERIVSEIPGEVWA